MRAPVMVVDDEPLVRRSLADALQRLGAEPVTAADGEEALARFLERRCPLILADIRLPRLDGLQLLRTVKRLAPDTAVVLITGAGAEDLLAQAREAGAWQVLTKPFTLEDLSRILRQAVRPGGRGLAEPPPLVTTDPRMEALLGLARRVAKTEATVLITGETGTGKELLARLIHAASSRAGGPLLSVNCAALPESLIEAELFGHERGAFTGAAARRAGRFEAAAGGTLVLDEVSELPLSVQPKLLRALQEREVVRVGSNRPVCVDVRIVALTNRDLAAEVRAGRFREDLYYRLNVVSLRLPPLRERRGDIPLLARHFLDRYSRAHGSVAQGFSPQALNLLLAHRWPGNVRELENVVQRAVILCSDREIGPEHLELEPLLAPAPAPGLTVHEMERQLILSTLERLNGNRTHTARALGLSVRTIRNRLRRYRTEAQAHLGLGPAGESA